MSAVFTALSDKVRHAIMAITCAVAEWFVIPKISEWIGPAYSVNFWHEHTAR